MTRERFGLWDPEAGPGMPLSLSDAAPPFHPLALLGNELAITAVCAIASALFCWFLWKRVPAAIAIGFFVVARPELALLTLGAWSIAAAAEWFAANPTRWRWLGLVLASTLALLGTRGDALTALGALTFAVVAIRRDDRVVAGGLAAAATAVLLAMPWILAGFAIRPEELPVEVQYTTEWPLAVCAAVPVALLRWRGEWGARGNWLIAVAAATLFVTGLLVQSAGTIVLSLVALAAAPAAVPALAVAAALIAGPLPGCEPCLSRRMAELPAAARRAPVPSFVPNLDRGTVDHVPPKLAARGAPHSGAAPGGSLSVQSKRADSLQLGVESNGWNVVATDRPAWTGWRAYWNGERIPPVIVHGGFVGSFVPPGTGTLLFRYRPDQFDTGIRVAAGGVLLLLFTMALPWYRRVTFPRPALHLPRVRFRPIYLLVPLVLYLIVLLANFADVAGGADSSGYLNFSRLWNRGDLIVPISPPTRLGLPPELAHLFIPLGFVHGREPYTMVPSYPPGLPLLMAGARLAGGDGAAFRIVAVLSALALPLLYFLGRTLGLSAAWSAAAAAILAVHPTFLFMSVQPMSDSVATAFAVAAMIGAFRARESIWWAVLAGAMMGAGVLVRPTQVLLFPAIVIALRLRPRALLALGLGGLPFAIVQAAVSLHFYGSPIATGYGSVGYLTTAEGALTRFRHYAYWLAVLGTPVMFPGGLAAWGSRVFDGWTRAAMAAWFLPFFIFYVFYPPYETWWYTRFLLPALPPLILGALAIAQRWRIAGPLLAALMAVTGVVHCASMKVLEFESGERVYTELVAGVAEQVPEEAMLIAMQASGALRYYGEREIVRGDGLTPETFDLLRKAAGSRPWYAVTAEFERDYTFRNAPGRWVEVKRYRGFVLHRMQSGQ